MEGLTRLVTESLARHGFDRPLDYRRLQWSRWFRCDSHHSLLIVPSKPGVFAVAEEIMDLGSNVDAVRSDLQERSSDVEERRLSAASRAPSIAALAAGTIAPEAESRKPEAARRMLAVTQFFEDDDMAFVLDRMLSRQNVMSSRLASGRYFVRFVVVEDQTQRRSICAALNQWIVSAAEKATGIAAEFATSLELTPATEYVPQADDRQQSLFAGMSTNREGHDFSRANRPAQISPALAAEGASSAHVATAASAVPRSEASGVSTKSASASTLSMTAPQLDSGAATNIHCPSPLPSGF
jgi:hypothetical protein